MQYHHPQRGITLHIGKLSGGGFFTKLSGSQIYTESDGKVSGD